MTKLDTHQLELIIEGAIQDALNGKLTDAHRSQLYRLALTVAGNEFYRIEETTGGSVSPEVLILIQQIVLLCDEDVTADQLLDASYLNTDDVAEA